jgi:hypothetical protein
VFWWYWSVRKRLLLLSAVLFPVVGFFAFKAVLGDGGSSTTQSTVATPVGGSLEVVVLQSDLLVLTSDDSRSAASVFPATFGDFGEGSVQTKNMVLPGQAFDEYSVYLFFGSLSPEDVVLPPVTTPVGGIGATTVPVVVEGPAVEVVEETFSETTVETVRERLGGHFRERGGIVRNAESPSGPAELFVAGLESGRGYQGTLRFFAVPRGVVVRGLVVEVPANEIADMIAESQAPLVSETAGAAEPTEGDAPATGEGPVVPPTTDTTVPSAPTTRP